jgi:hypothetical protein
MGRTKVFAKYPSMLILALAFFIIGGFYQVKAQSQAINGQIEGVVADSTGATIPNANVTVKNIESGLERTVTSDGDGVYRVPLLPLGTYRITIEAANFKRYVREGVTLTTGQTATIDAAMEAGDVSATVTITSDAPVADPGKIDVGRVMNAREVQNLPLVSRNPYNYSLLQANVTGRPNSEFGVPRINANGYARRTNYQLDGNNNTQADRAGIRLMPISEIFVSEVQLVTNGFSAEFGNTPGLIMNAVTPSGTNGIHGSVSYRFRRTPLYARPFFYNSPRDLPKNKADDFAFAIGGPIIKDRWQYYGGFEYIKRGLAVEPGRLITIPAATQASLIAAGLSASALPAAIPTQQNAKFYIIRTDAQLNDNNRLTGRFNLFKNLTTDNIGGGATTLERSVDFDDLAYSGAVQLVSSFSTNYLNEFRFQYAKRNSNFLVSPNSGTGPSIVISGIANFGSPEDKDTVSPLETMTQFIDNFTLTQSNHSIKFGGGVNRIYDFRKAGIFSRYTFSSIANYVNAKNGTDPFAYTTYTAAFGTPEIAYKSYFYNAFVQDDWKVTPKLKINYGLRYDVYKVPNADSTSPFSASQKFKTDKNNFAPRLGVVYSLRDGKYATILRASGGIYYDPPAIDIYRRALQNNGNPKYYNFSIAGRSTTTGTVPVGAPAFPGNLSTATVPTGQSIDTVAPDFKTMYAIHTNFQVEQSLTNDISFTGGFIHSSGRHIPVYRLINRRAVIRTLADGRPVFDTSAATRLDPRFGNILIAESAGNSNYNAATFQLNKRFSQGYQFSVNYTLSKSTDDAPEQNLVAASTLILSDPTNRALDKGLSLADQRHTFVMSLVGRPKFEIDNKVLSYILNGNQFGVIATANSGERYNIVATTDLNQDGLSGSDRPVGIGRNSGKTPKQFNVDMRYSRIFSFTERFKLEGFVEATNIFNINSVFQYNNLAVAADATTGNLIGTLPDFKARGATALDSRNLQIGFKFIF